MILEGRTKAVLEHEFQTSAPPIIQRQLVSARPVPEEVAPLPGIAEVDRTVYVPLVLLSVVVAVLALLQVYMLGAEAGSLRQIAAAQQQAAADSSAVRGSLDGLARGLRRLADADDPDAQHVIADLRKSGVMVHEQQGLVVLRKTR